MAALSPVGLVGRSLSRATEKYLPAQRDPLPILIARVEATATTREGRAIANAMIGVMTGEGIDERDKGAIEPYTLGLVLQFAQRWSQGAYGGDELPQVVRLLSPR